MGNYKYLLEVPGSADDPDSPQAALSKSLTALIGFAPGFRIFQDQAARDVLEFQYQAHNLWTIRLCTAERLEETRRTIEEAGVKYEMRPNQLHFSHPQTEKNSERMLFWNYYGQPVLVAAPDVPLHQIRGTAKLRRVLPEFEEAERNFYNRWVKDDDSDESGPPSDKRVFPNRGLALAYIREQYLEQLIYQCESPHYPVAKAKIVMPETGETLVYPSGTSAEEAELIEVDWPTVIYREYKDGQVLVAGDGGIHRSSFDELLTEGSRLVSLQHFACERQLDQSRQELRMQLRTGVVSSTLEKLWIENKETPSFVTADLYRFWTRVYPYKVRGSN